MTDEVNRLPSSPRRNSPISEAEGNPSTNEVNPSLFPPKEDPNSPGVIPWSPPLPVEGETDIMTNDELDSLKE